MANMTSSRRGSDGASSGGQATLAQAEPHDLDEFIASPTSAFHPIDIPPEQWQGALAHRSLTPQEQAAREWYFEQRITQALARFRASRRCGPQPAGRR